MSMKKKDVKKLVYCVLALVLTIGVLKIFSFSVLVARQDAAVTSSSATLSTACIPTSVTKCGTIIITKDAIPDDYQDFSFVHTIPGYASPFILDDDATLTSPSSIPNQQIISTPPSGNFTVAEQIVQPVWNSNTNQFEGGYSTSIICGDPSGGTTTSATSASISMSGAETVKCTFKNLAIVPTTQACTSNTWSQKTNFPGGARNLGTAFSTAGKGYYATGFGLDTNTDDLWEYSPASNMWMPKASFSGGVRDGAFSFAIGDKGYMGGGHTSYLIDNSDFWEYDPVTNIWTQKANFGGGVRQSAVGFSIGSKGYAGTGLTYTAGNGYTNFQDFWEYNPATNMWSQKASLGGQSRGSAIGFAVGSKGYIGTGRHFNSNGSGTLLSDFWEYDPSTNTWGQRANFGGGVRAGAVAFSIGLKGYVGTGLGATYAMSDFWEYDPSTNSWLQRASVSGPRRYGSGFSVDGKGYIGWGYGTVTGQNGQIINYQDLWQYCP